jgi:hypothetical protein
VDSDVLLNCWIYYFRTADSAPMIVRHVTTLDACRLLRVGLTPPCIVLGNMAGA